MLSLLKEVKPSPNENMITLQTFGNLFPRVRHCDILAKTRGRMATATSFSRQNDVGLPVSTT